MSLEKVIGSIESGRQVGKRISYEIQGQPYYSIVAVQKWNGDYIVVIWEIAEKNMAAEVFDKDIEALLPSLEEAIAFVNKNSRADISELGPLKGSKAFDAEGTWAILAGRQP